MSAGDRTFVGILEWELRWEYYIDCIVDCDG